MAYDGQNRELFRMASTINKILKLSTAPLALSAALVSSAASAQGTPANVSDAKDAENTIVVVGSSIKQAIDKSPLPVTVLSAGDIAKTGQMSATDVIQNLPAMQGFVPASSSVNGGGAGVSTAAIHALPSKYTLTLLDGQRVAPRRWARCRAAATVSTSSPSRSTRWRASKCCATARARSMAPMRWPVW
jgi:iron complex outermembrane receptor protein